MIIDLTTSFDWRGRNPVGIVRTEREIAKYVIKNRKNVVAVRFDRQDKSFIKINNNDIEEIIGVETNTSRLGKTIFAQNFDIPFEFKNGDVLISAGLVWDADFLKYIYHEKSKINIIVAQIIYDIIPIIMPEYCVPGMDIKFPKFIVDTIWTADIIYCISDATLTDLKTYIDKIGLQAPILSRINLGIDTSKNSDQLGIMTDNLLPGNFVLYVSTIEPRKNHQMLFNIWRDLHKNSPNSLVPLVFVGNKGWNMDEFINCLHNCDYLYPKYIKILNNVNDVTLDWLYKNSIFSVYPSMYEGWGLPVSESLARGKFCISSDGSSLPEVAAGYAELIAALDYKSWYERIKYYLENKDVVLSKENFIKEEYKSKTWTECMKHFVGSFEKDLLSVSKGKGN